MATYTNQYHEEIDKITERELVYDIITRLFLGKDIKNPDYQEDYADTYSPKTIFKAGTKLKGGISDLHPDEDGTKGNSIINGHSIPYGKNVDEVGVLINMIRNLKTVDILNLGKDIKTSFEILRTGDTAVEINIPTGYNVYKIIQENTDTDVTPLFVRVGASTTMNVDTPAKNNTLYKAYFYRA